MSAFANILRAIGLGQAEPTRGIFPGPSPFAAFLLPGETFAPKPPTWHALPGNRIELGATGFAIEARYEDREGRVYRLWSPEGVLLASGGTMMLQGLKGMAEQLARDRREFEAPRADWWAP